MSLECRGGLPTSSHLSSSQRIQRTGTGFSCSVSTQFLHTDLAQLSRFTALKGSHASAHSPLTPKNYQRGSSLGWCMPWGDTILDLRLLCLCVGLSICCFFISFLLSFCSLLAVQPLLYTLLADWRQSKAAGERAADANACRARNIMLPTNSLSQQRCTKRGGQALALAEPFRIPQLPNYYLCVKLYEHSVGQIQSRSFRPATEHVFALALT